MEKNAFLTVETDIMQVKKLEIAKDAKNTVLNVQTQKDVINVFQDSLLLPLNNAERHIMQIAEEDVENALNTAKSVLRINVLNATERELSSKIEFVLINVTQDTLESETTV
jgi:hypothetical protein